MGMRERQPFPSPGTAQRVMDPAGHAQLAYVEPADLPRWLAMSRTYPLAVVSFGSPLSFPVACPVIHLDLPPLDVPRQCEVWSSTQPVRTHQEGSFFAAVSGDVLFGSISVAEGSDSLLDHTTAMAYRDILRHIRGLGFTHLWRMWNYFPGINEEQHGLERYRRFCVGRHQALAETLSDFPGSLPAGTAVGTRSGPLQIYFLAGTHPVTHIGNPRQVDAYNYPKHYGPRSPSFARATLCRSEIAVQLFIAGTASVVGHASQHRGLPDRQARETLTNLHTLIDRADCFEDDPRPHSFFKVYVRNPEHLEAVRRTLQDSPLMHSSQQLFLQGDLCRQELLVEIEGLITAD